MDYESSTKQYHQTGFTMIELMVTVAIAGIILAIATPNFSTFIKNNRILAEQNKLMNSISFARNLAMSVNTKGMLCRSKYDFNATNLKCRTSGSALDWHNHAYMVYTINSNNATQKANLLTELSASNGAPGSHLGRLKLNTLVSAADRPALAKSFEEGAKEALVTINTNRQIHVLAFNGDGTLYNDAPIYFAICDDRDNPEDFGRYIQINQSGRIRSAETDVSQTLTSCNPGA